MYQGKCHICGVKQERLRPQKNMICFHCNQERRRDRINARNKLKRLNLSNMRVSKSSCCNSFLERPKNGSKGFLCAECHKPTKNPVQVKNKPYKKSCVGVYKKYSMKGEWLQDNYDHKEAIMHDGVSTYRFCTRCGGKIMK